MLESRWVIGRYYYDASGARVKKVTNTETTIFVYSSGNLVAEYSTATPPATPTVNYTTSDHLGSPLALLDERGQLAWSAELDPRGLPRPVRGDPALCPFRHPGQLADPDTGLHHNRLRELDPDTGRYLSPDPLGLLGSLDLHAHLDDPATTTDILGLAPDLPHGVHARIAAELVADFPRHDLPPHLAELAQDPTQQTGQLASQPPDQQPGQPTDRRTGIATIYATPPRGPCD